MVAAEQHQTFEELIVLLYTMFGGKHYVVERTHDLIQFKTKSVEGPADIILRWHKTKFDIKLELEYASECKVSARKRLKPSYERLMEVLLDSLGGLVRKLVYKQNPTTMEDTEDALVFTQSRFEEKIQVRSKDITGK
ncbi:hypothetical protein RFI_28615 [Reticulomyxa filosa]|uniref:Uncharacterized protein n=1 Tax=Reticulomyxa filosa TaxID=46433 RepID=X6M5M0_RETFI|nr:hypothetical protein RFI_28615 [Reticulomyxa filosa]|eukprot:ETO08767.1 hypothetical protein RFI_28615 [Reticulomyxa filosa]